MDKTHRATHELPVSVSFLPADLLFMVFEELQAQKAKTSLASMRLVCHQFNDLLTPFVYSSMRLSYRRISDCDLLARPPVWTACERRMRMLTKHVTIDEALKMPAVMEIVSTLTNLRTIT